MRVSLTRTIPKPNEYILAIHGECSAWTYDEEAAPRFKGKWRDEAFRVTSGTPLDLEIGTGNGLHFAHRAVSQPDRCLLGFELRYKPLIQTIRRAVRDGATNARVARYNAYLLRELFTPGEVDNAFIFFPDPWEKSRNHKHRLIQDAFLEQLFEVQRAGSTVVFKTDSQDYFEWAVERFLRSRYVVTHISRDLHGKEPLAVDNFITQFEQLFIRQNLKIGYAALRKPL